MQVYNQILFYLILILFILQTISTPQTRLQFHQYCTYHNYPVEQHIITTQDNVNLKFFRIQKKNTSITGGKKVIYLQHGLADSSDTFIVNEESIAPAFILANKGYDVWLGNNRGNKYSNAALSPKIRNYWDFSFDDLAKYDLQAAFKYIAHNTSSKIHYIGHSQGTLIMFIALSMKYPNVQQYINTYTALGPVVYLTHVESALLLRLMKANTIDTIGKSGGKVFLFPNDQQYLVQSRFCTVSLKSCAEGLKDISQKNNSVNNLERLPVIMGHFPAGSSVKNFIQFQQYVKTGLFRKFDYGHVQNLKIYGTADPPAYNISNINVPVHLFVGIYDKLATVTDVKKLYGDLVNSQNRTITQLPFGHATFIWGKDSSYLEKVVKIIEDHQQNTKNLKKDK